MPNNGEKENNMGKNNLRDVDTSICFYKISKEF